MDEKISKSELKMFRQAVNNRWPISQAAKAKAIKQILKYLENKHLSARELSSLTKCLISCEAQNQTDQIQHIKDSRLDAGLSTENTQIIITVPKPRGDIEVA